MLLAEARKKARNFGEDLLEERNARANLQFFLFITSVLPFVMYSFMSAGHDGVGQFVRIV